MAIYIIMAILVIAVHLIAIKKRLRYVKSISKVFLIPYLFMTFLVLTETNGVIVPGRGLLMAALVFYTLGDLLLEFEKEGMFRIGGISFSVGHILYSAFFLSHGFSFAMAVLFIGIWALIYIFLFEDKMRALRPNSTPYLIYAIIVMLLGVSVGATDFGGNWIAKMIAVAGTVSFAFSDALVIIRETDDTKNEEERVADDLLIMVTYIGANILLLSSVALVSVMA